MIRRPPRSTRTDTLFPYTTLFRADVNLDLVTDIIACPGLDYCSLANARSIPVAQKIAQRFADLERQQDLGELKIKISGCINACGHHHAGHIGILGRSVESRVGKECVSTCSFRG